MRFAAALCLAIAACSPPAAAPPAPTASAPTASAPIAPAPGAASPPAFTLANEAVVGQWSFDRTCGLYDLVFHADASVDYFDYADPGAVVSYGGQWDQDGDTITLTLHRLDAAQHFTDAPIAYTLNVTAPPTDDLVGSFGPSGAAQQTLNAKRCPNEDRD